MRHTPPPIFIFTLEWITVRTLKEYKYTTGSHITQHIKTHSNQLT